AGIGHPGGQVLGGNLRSVNLFHILKYPLPLPAVGDQVPQSGVGDSVGHQQEHIAALQSQAAFQYPLVTHHQFLGGIFHAFAVPRQNGLGIVKLGQVDLPVGKHLHQSKGGIGQLTHAAHRQSLGQGGDAVPDGQVVGRHGGQNLGGESGQNIGLDPAAHAV